MFWKKRGRELDRLSRVVNLIPEYVDALIDERMGARAMEQGLDGRELHGPAVRKLEKVEERIAAILSTGGDPRSEVGYQRSAIRGRRSAGLTGAQVRRIFLSTIEKEAMGRG
jgi:hypothetical protein